MDNAAKRIRIAIVEDMPDTLARFKHLIEGQPDELQLAYESSTGIAMQTWLQNNAPDVLLVDLGLPDISGLEVIRSCRLLSPITDVMVITLFGDETHMMQAFEAGATGYLLKDGGENELAAHIKNLHSGGSPMSPSIARQLLKRLNVDAVNNAASTAVLPATGLMTHRERELLLHLSQGFSYQELAQLNAISISTVNTHIKNIYRKLEVHSKTEAIFEARQLGILPN